MQKIKKFRNIAFTLIAACTVLISCNGDFLDVNVDPNNPLEANAEQLFPAAQIELAVALGNDYNFISSMWAQYWTSGKTIQLPQIENFELQGGDIQDSWNGTYVRALIDMKVLIDNAAEQPIFAGMSKILTAYAYQMIVDVHGKAPFTEALKGAIDDGGILTPSYDDGETIYAALIPMIDDGLALLEETGALIVFPSSEDLIYNGDLDNWKAFANTLKLKILMRQSVSDASKLAEAVTLINSGVSFIDESHPSATVFFSGTKNSNSNPLWSRFESRAATGMYMRASQTSIDFLTSTADPRMSSIYDKGANANFTGYTQGDSQEPQYGPIADNDFAQPGSVNVYASNVPTFLLTSWESLLLQAEAMVRSNSGGGELLWARAIAESMAYHDVDAIDALAYGVGLVFGATNDEKLRSIALEKWVAMNGVQMGESWIECKRFDVESADKIIFRGTGGIFHTPSGTKLGQDQFPSAFVYPPSETSFNPNTPDRDVTDKVFWDN